MKQYAKRVAMAISVCLLLGMGTIGCEKPTAQKSISTQALDTATGTAVTVVDTHSDTTYLQPTDTFTEPTSTDTCANLDLALDRQPTTIMLVIDRSASMDHQLGDNDTRWSVLVNSLMGTVENPEAGLVWALEKQVNFGIVLFTANRSHPETCPTLESIAPNLRNGGDIAAVFKADDETYKGSSPVPEGIAAATQLLEEMGGLSKKVILLATDGFPQTCATLGVSGTPEAAEQTIAAVQNAFQKEISTFVVGVGDDTTVEHLQQVANAGVGLSPDGTENAVFYQGVTENSLAEAITQIVTTESRSCIYELDGKGIADGEENAGTVSLDNVPLELDNNDYGWHLKSPSEIELLGGACDDIQIGQHHLEADFPCEVIVQIVVE